MCTGKIGIGIGIDADRVVKSILRYSYPDQIICYAENDSIPDLTFPCKVIIDPQPDRRLVSDLLSGHLAAAVRGTLSSNDALHALKQMIDVKSLERMVLLETHTGDRFFLAPVGVDEGWTVEQKVSFIRRGRSLTGFLGMEKAIGVLSGGRLGDVGRHPVVDRTLADAELVARITGAVHYEIRLEDAIRECSLIIAPDGISGNLIFRSILFAGNGFSHGAPVMNIEPIFIDTSRVNPDYSKSLDLARFLIIRRQT